MVSVAMYSVRGCRCRNVRYTTRRANSKDHLRRMHLRCLQHSIYGHQHASDGDSRGAGA
jgi:hypothetical protein